MTIVNCSRQLSSVHFFLGKSDSQECTVLYIKSCNYTDLSSHDNLIHCQLIKLHPNNVFVLQKKQTNKISAASTHLDIARQ